MFQLYHVQIDLMILQVPNQIALSHRQESSDDSLAYCWFLAQNQHRNRFSQTASYGFRLSMSRKGNPYDNAIMESFYRTLKRELVQDAHYDNPEQARMDIFKYIELYYNTKRIHSALGWLSPTQFESQSL